MAGWFDNWRRIRGWASASNPAIGGPYYVDEAETFIAGSILGDTYRAGREQGEIFNSGAVQGEADGRSS